MIALPSVQTGVELLRGKRVVVTAAAGSGIGFATARRCLEQGAQVLLSDLASDCLLASMRPDTSSTSIWMEG